MGKKNKKRVEKIEVTDATEESQLSEKDLEEVQGGLTGIRIGGVRGLVASSPTDLTQLTETSSLQDPLLGDSALGNIGVRGKI